MEIIILDINKKDKLLLKKQKKEVINCANLIASGRNIEIIESIENYDINIMNCVIKTSIIGGFICLYIIK